MLVRLKEVLLTQYIGAIAIAFIAADGVAKLISVGANAIAWLAVRNQPDLVGNLRRLPFNWDRLINPAVGAVLSFAVAYWLVRWLYFSTTPSTQEEAGASE